jgi:glutamate carboxypeptidase
MKKFLPFNFAALSGLIIILLTASAISAQSLTAEEKRIVAHIDNHIDEAVALLEKTVNIESPTQNLEGVKTVGAIFQQEFAALGFKTHWIDTPAEVKRSGHLLAEHSGTKGKRILLLGHIDTVLAGEKFRREGSRAYGTGSSDMKAGDIVLLYALRALCDSGALRDRQVIVMLTGDEEASGKPVSISRGEMVEAAKRSDVVLSFEGGSRGFATVGRRGSSSWTLEVGGVTGHSSRIFSDRLGSGAIFEASRILHEFYEVLHHEKYLTFNPSVIAGGSQVDFHGTGGSAEGKSNVISNKVMVRGDLRFISEEQKERARAKMREIVAKNLPRTSAKITFEDGIPAMTPTPANDALLSQLSQVSEDLGFGKVEAIDPGERGAGDIAYIAHLVSGLDGLGASGSGAHAPGEYADLDSLHLFIKRAAVLLYRLTR